MGPNDLVESVEFFGGADLAGGQAHGLNIRLQRLLGGGLDDADLEGESRLIDSGSSAPAHRLRLTALHDIVR